MDGVEQQDRSSNRDWWNNSWHSQLVEKWRAGRSTKQELSRKKWRRWHRRICSPYPDSKHSSIVAYYSHEFGLRQSCNKKKWMNWFKPWQVRWQIWERQGQRKEQEMWLSVCSYKKISKSETFVKLTSYYKCWILESLRQDKHRLLCEEKKKINFWQQQNPPVIT